MAANPHYWVMKHDEMHFVYAAFFVDRSDVYVKFGESVTPYKRILAVTQNCPFPIDKAVFAHAGSKKVANSIESKMKNRLNEFNVRGEWYRFRVEEGKIFSCTVQAVFAAVTGRKLAWTEVDMLEVSNDLMRNAERRRGKIAA